jgi:hypothetical protein
MPTRSIHATRSADATFLGDPGERRQQRPPIGTVLGGERAQQIAGDAVREELNTRGQSIEPRLQRVLARCEPRDLPMRIDVDDGHEPPPLAGVRTPV